MAINKLPGPVSSSNDIRLELRSWTEVDEYLKTCKGIILPIGSTEQHGPTGAIGTDAITAEAVAREVGRQTGVLVAPTQVFGMAEHHLGFSGTMSLRPCTLIAVVHDLVLSLARNGFERVFVINGHGGNIASLKAGFAQAYTSAMSQNLHRATYLSCKLVNWFMVKKVIHKAQELYGDMEGQHATPSEISVTLHVEPSLLSKQRPLPPPSPAGPIYGYEDFQRRYPDGRMGSDPFLAKATHGKVFIEQASIALIDDLFNFLSS